MTSSTPVIKRARGGLEKFVLDICDLIVEDKIEPLPEGQLWTPHRLAKVISERYPGSGVPPSTGAIADTLKRWRDLGFANIQEDPLAFLDYTQRGIDDGLPALKEESRQRRLEARRQAKAAASSNGTEASAAEA